MPLIKIVITDGGLSLEKECAHDLLTKSFGNVVGYGEYDIGIGSNLYTCAIPNLYHMSPGAPPLVNKLRKAFGMSAMWRAQPIQGIGLTKEQSADMLLDKAIKSAMRRDLYLLAPQRSQGDTPIIAGKAYELVHLHQERHDHNSPRVVNFSIVTFSPLSGFDKGSTDVFAPHSHFWLK